MQRLLALMGLGVTLAQASHAPAVQEPQLPRAKLAAENFGADAPWYLRNIPFLDIDDREIQQVYYYRWKVFRAHVREIGAEGTTVLEFLDNVPWARQPFTDLNDSASFHILEGRWLRDPAIIDSLIDHLYAGGANDRHFSESIAAATESSTRVTGDPGPGLRQLDRMRAIFDQWDDHLDRTRRLYWIEPLLDATEYTIASIDASGAGFTQTASTDQNHNGFTGGFAFRPSINSYQYANAKAIARFASLAGKADIAADFSQRATTIQTAVLEQLWHPGFEHFVDRYQRTTNYVREGEFIRGRELVGYVPWAFELPPQDAAVSRVAAASPNYAGAWRHLVSPSELAGARGLRTVEPSYPRYLTQYRYEAASGRAECQWNGPSWPFQTAQALTGLANLLDDYSQSVVTRADYLRLFRQYTHQHYALSGELDIQEDYDPDTGEAIVGLPRSHHYEHSTYVDLVVSGLIGIRPRSDDVLEVAPLISTEPSDVHATRYFALQNLSYHGHDVGVIYDESGKRYGAGKGMSLFVDGKRVYGPAALSRVSIPLAPWIGPHPPGVARRIDLAVNPGIPDGPAAAASSTDSPNGVPQAIDGRMWFFPSNLNGWSPSPKDGSRTSWYSIDFKRSRTVGSVELYFLGDGGDHRAPKAYRLQHRTPRGWRDIPLQHRLPRLPLANGENIIAFPAINTQALRIVFDNPRKPGHFRLVEFKAFAEQRTSHRKHTI